MTQNEFRLLPWEWNIENAPAPHRETEILLDGHLRPNHFKAHQDRVFFRLSDDEKKRVFAITTPLPVNLDEDQLKAFFLEEYRRGHVGLMMRALVPLRKDDIAVIVVIWNSDDSGVLREWVAPQWIAFGSRTAQPKPDAKVWDNDWYALDPGRFINRLMMLDVSFDGAAQENTLSNWHGSSAHEIEQVVRALGALFSPSTPSFPRGFGPSTFNSFHHRPASVFSARQTHFGTGWPSRWNELLSPLLPSASQQWVRCPQFSPDTRRGWRLEVEGTISLQCPPAQSQHERLEALLFLRDWLQAQVPEDEIKAYLPDDLA